MPKFWWLRVVVVVDIHLTAAVVVGVVELVALFMPRLTIYPRQATTLLLELGELQYKVVHILVIMDKILRLMI
jgi:hypothetical protein